MFYWVIFGSMPRWDRRLIFHSGGNYSSLKLPFSCLSYTSPLTSHFPLPTSPLLPRRHSLSDLGYSPASSFSDPCLPQISGPLRYCRHPGCRDAAIFHCSFTSNSADPQVQTNNTCITFTSATSPHKLDLFVAPWSLLYDQPMLPKTPLNLSPPPRPSLPPTSPIP